MLTLKSYHYRGRGYSIAFLALPFRRTNLNSRILKFPDEDECSKRLCGQAACVNTPGSYHCSCRRGYRFQPLSRSCTGTCCSCITLGIVVTHLTCKINKLCLYQSTRTKYVSDTRFSYREVTIISNNSHKYKKPPYYPAKTELVIHLCIPVHFVWMSRI